MIKLLFLLDGSVYCRFSLRVVITPLDVSLPSNAQIVFKEVYVTFLQCCNIITMDGYKMQ